MSRDNPHTDAVGRRPVGGFSTRPPWIQLNPNYPEVNAAAEMADPDSVFHQYRGLIELRHTEPVAVHGSFQMLLPNDERIYAFTRRLGPVELRCDLLIGTRQKRTRTHRLSALPLSYTQRDHSA